MIPARFEYVRAETVKEAVALLSKHGADAKILAGGHSLIPSMKLRLSEPATLIDISGISELNGIHEKGDRLEIGAFVTHRTVEFSQEVKGSCPVLAQAAGLIGDPIVRNRGTLGGSLAHADPAADYPALILALNAEVYTSGPAGARRIAADDFFTGLFETALAEGEIITRVSFPVTGRGRAAAYQKFPHPASRFAVVGVAVFVTVDKGICSAARVAVTGAASTVFRAGKVEAALIGKALDDRTIADATREVAPASELNGDLFASEEYRAHLCSVMAGRALHAAAAAV